MRRWLYLSVPPFSDGVSLQEPVRFPQDLGNGIRVPVELGRVDADQARSSGIGPGSILSEDTFSLLADDFLQSLIVSCDSTSELNPEQVIISRTFTHDLTHLLSVFLPCDLDRCLVLRTSFLLPLALRCTLLILLCQAVLLGDAAADGVDDVDAGVCVDSHKKASSFSRLVITKHCIFTNWRPRLSSLGFLYLYYIILYVDSQFFLF